VIVHPGYDANTMDNDLSLVKMTSSSNLPTIGYMNAGAYTMPGACATVAGWGTQSEGGDISQTLYKVGLQQVSNEECNNDYNGSIIPDQICAADPGQDSCQGDSGGPLFVKDENSNFVQIGIVSWGNGCAEEGYPGVYTRVANYVDWITETMNNN